MNVLITGGTGFIGSRLALKLLDDGHTVRVLGQENNEAEAERKRLVESKGAEVILGSVTDRADVTSAVEGTDVVFHLAAAQHEANAPDQLFWDVNVSGTRNVLDASVAAGVTRFVHGSTIGVYGSAMDGIIDEETPLRPDNIYGITKREAEELVQSYGDKLPVVIIRISETYGPGDRRLLKLFKGIKNRAFFMIGDGENLHHLIFVDDLIDGLWLAATEEEAIGKTFILAGKEAITTNEMVATIAREVGTDPLPVRAPLTPFLLIAAAMETVLRPFGIQPPLHRRRMDFFKKSFAFASERATAVLGFEPHRSFRRGVAATAEWYVERGEL